MRYITQRTMGETLPLYVTRVLDILDRWRHSVLKEFDSLSEVRSSVDKLRKCLLSMGAVPSPTWNRSLHFVTDKMD
jgi:hypothetical protein